MYFLRLFWSVELESHVRFAPNSFVLSILIFICDDDGQKLATVKNCNIAKHSVTLVTPCYVTLRNMSEKSHRCRNIFKYLKKSKKTRHQKHNGTEIFDFSKKIKLVFLGFMVFQYFLNFTLDSASNFSEVSLQPQIYFSMKTKNPH
jgi:hypothetical protein